MSRNTFRNRLERIGKPVARPAENATSHQAAYADPLRDEEDAPIIVDIALLALLGGMALWLLFDFWRALPFVVIIALVLGGYSIARELYFHFTGTRRHRRRSPLWEFFSDLWY